MINGRTNLAAGCAFIALLSTPAFAQDTVTAPPPPVVTATTAASDSDSDAAIVVTARRQNERLLDVPASVTVISAKTLEITGIKTADQFVQLTPGVTIVTGTAEAGDTQINIRGINGARDAESSVALVVDGILKSNTAMLNQDQGTLRQIEVLKGPQGALYGRNAAAGAIVISTLLPTATLSGGGRLSYAERHTLEGSAYLAGPISENIGFVVSGNYRKTDGFYTNILTDDHTVDNQKRYGIDGRLVFKPSAATTVDIKGRYEHLSGASINFNAAFHLPAFAAFNPAFNEDVNDHPFRYYNNIVPTNKQRTIEGSIKLDQDLGALKLVTWAQYSDVKQSLTADGTSADFARYISPALGGPVNAVNTAVSNTCFASTAALTGFPVNQPGFIGAVPIPFIFAPATGSTFGPYSPTTCDGTQYQERNQKDFSAEARFVSTGKGPFSYQFGGYYLHIDRLVGVSLGADLGQGVLTNLYNGPNTTNPTSQLFADKFKTNVYAAFASGDYAFSDQFKASLALRYDIEDRAVSSRVPVETDPITGGPINPGQAFGPIPDQSKTYKQLEPKLSLSYRPNAQTNIYADWGVGFKSGGFNNQGASAIVNAAFNVVSNAPGTINAGVLINDNFRKERSSAFEAGIKGSFVNGAITYDLAGYYTRIRDMQFFEFFVGSFGLLRVVSNIDRVDVKGVELNLTAKPYRWWSLFGSVNITDSEIKKNASRPYTVGNKSPYTADYTINLGTQVEAPISNTIKLFARADYRLTGPTWFHTVQDETVPTLFTGLIPISALTDANGNPLPGSLGNANYSIARRDKFGIINLRGGFEVGNFRIAAFANNLLDKKYVSEVIPAIEFGGSFVSPGDRRIIGVEVSGKF